MNPGKAVAQGAHAANQFALAYKGFEGVEEWQQEGDGFGTTVVLGVNEAEMRRTVTLASSTKIPHDIVHDSSYPIRDGSVTHLIPLDTCGYVFGTKEDLLWLVSHLPLMP